MFYSVTIIQAIQKREANQLEICKQENGNKINAPFLPVDYRIFKFMDMLHFGMKMAYICITVWFFIEPVMILRVKEVIYFIRIKV